MSSQCTRRQHQPQTTARSLAFVVIAMLGARSAPAQRVPWLRGTLEAGPEAVVGGEFTQLHSGVAIQGAVTARLFVVRGVGVTATGAYQLMGSSGDVVSLCEPSVHGGCKPIGPGFRGWSGRIGFERPLAAHAILAGALGLGWFANNGSSRPAGSRIVPARVGLVAPLPHVAFSIAFERTEFLDFGGERFHSNALLFGISVP